MSDTPRRSWVASANAPGCPFPLQNLPFGVFSTDGQAPRCGVAIGDFVLDLAACEAGGLIEAGGAFAAPALNAFMALGPQTWQAVREALTGMLAEGAGTTAPLVPMEAARLHLPFEVAEYTDFYASRHHAFNVGCLFRGPENALPPQWTHMPIGYNGRASSVVVSGTPIRRPMGQLKAEGGPVWSPSRRLDLELELGAVVGQPSAFGGRVTVAEAERMIFGYVLLNDWSARDIQAWEYQPLGPFQSKAFATTISPWVVTTAALEPFRRAGAPRDNDLLPYLREERPGFYDLDLAWSLNGEVLGRTNHARMYYSAAQQLAHHAACGCPMRVGDLLGSGTISGPTRDSAGCLLEMTEGGRRPVQTARGPRTFLEDGDSVALGAQAQGEGYSIGFGPCEGVVLRAEG